MAGHRLFLVSLVLIAASPAQDVARRDPETLAFRLDDHRVAVLLDYDGGRRADQSLPALDTPLRYLGAIAPLPGGLPEPYAVRDRTGDRWTVASNRSRYAMTLEQFALGQGPECGEGTSALAILSTRNAAFARDRAKYFVAFRAGTEPGQDGRNPVMALTLSATRQQLLAETIAQISRERIPALFPAGARIDARDVQAFRLSPDGAPRLFVRSQIVEGRRTRPGLVLWLKLDTGHFIVESADDWFATFNADRSPESRGSSQKASDFRFVLNVIPAADGWTYVIFGEAGYEGVRIAIDRYSAAGFVRVGTAYEHGC